MHGGLPTPLAVSSQSSDLPPASRWQSLATTGTLTQGWQGRRQESPTYYAGLTRGACCGVLVLEVSFLKERKKTDNPRDKDVQKS